jgi:hypothetical protein
MKIMVEIPDTDGKGVPSWSLHGKVTARVVSVING